jgi:hypothetical protein
MLIYFHFKTHPESKMKMKKAIDYIRTKIQENKDNAIKLLSLTTIAIQQTELENLANTLQGFFTVITLLCWAFVGIKLLSGYGLISLPFASRMMKERGHRESEESIGVSLLIAIGVTLIYAIITMMGNAGIKVKMPPESWNK